VRLLPDEIATRTIDVALVLHADHELNASTFAARVTAATLSDMYSSVVSAIGALKGPLHGGANEGVIKNLLEIGSVDKVEEWTMAQFAKKQKIMGFGHRVYRTEDPRATHLRKMSGELAQRTGETRYYDMSRKMEEVVMREKKLNPNVDFYSASTYYTLGIPIDLYTPIFAVSRISGWTAHILEQYAHNRLIRPRADYIGPPYPQRFVSLEQR
jgi:citrate synthase